MFALIKKDIIFTKKWILLSVVYAVGGHLAYNA